MIYLVLDMNYINIMDAMHLRSIAIVGKDVQSDQETILFKPFYQEVAWNLGDFGKHPKDQSIHTSSLYDVLKGANEYIGRKFLNGSAHTLWALTARTLQTLESLINAHFSDGVSWKQSQERCLATAYCVTPGTHRYPFPKRDPIKLDYHALDGAKAYLQWLDGLPWAIEETCQTKPVKEEIE